MTTSDPNPSHLPDDPVDLLVGGEGESPAREKRRWINIAIQAIGFAIGIVLLILATRLAFNEKNQQELAKLKDASYLQIGALLALSLASTIINGLIFQQTLKPVRKLGMLDCASINAIASFLGYLPMKVNLLVRIAIHTRRDRVPLLTIGAWFAAVAVMLLGTIGVITAMALARSTIDAIWIAGAVLGLVALGTFVVFFSRLFAGRTGLGRLRTMASKLGLGFVNRFLASERFEHVHAGTDMLAKPGTVASVILLRVLDILAQAARFPLAAAIIGQQISYRDAFLFAAAGFLISILWPTGPTGAREFGIIQLCKKLNIANAEAFAVVVLLIAATEVIAYLAGAIAGLLYLGPTRLFKPRNATS